MKTWFITGSSSGIGRGIARAVLEKGDNAVVMARDIRKLDEMVQQYPDGIDTMLICGGGTVNWTFLQQGVVDELSLMLAPAADGTPDTVSVFEKSSLLSASAPVEFQMKIAKLSKWRFYLKFISIQ